MPEDKYHPWSTAIDAREEARRRGDRRIGTEHLLVAVLSDPVVADALGSDVESARAALAALDREALAAVGLASVPEVPDLPAQEPGQRAKRPTFRDVLHDRLPTTPTAKAVLREGRKDMKGGGTGSVGPRHIVEALLELRSPDPAAELRNRLGIEPGPARERLSAA